MRVVTLDFETRWSDEYTLKKLSTAEYIFDPRFGTLGVAIKVDKGPARYFENVQEVLAHAKPQIEESAVLCHHANFDGLILSHHFGIRPKLWLDTLPMARALGLQGTVGGSLQALCEHFGLGSKSELRPDSTPEEVKARAVQDIELTWALFGKLLPGFPADELKVIDWTVRCFTEPRLVLNDQRCADLIQTLRERKQRILDDLGVDKKQLGSTVMLAQMLKALGVDPPMKPSPTNPDEMIYAFAKTDQGMRDLAECGDPEVEALVAARLDLKSAGDQTRAERLRTLWTAVQKLPVYLNYSGAHTHRWSGGDGTNFQNLSKERKDAKGVVVEGTGEIRRSIEAPEGHVLVVGDASQVECRITMWLAQQLDGLEAFKRGDDLYSDLATEIFEKPCSKKTPFERFVGKSATLGCGFGMGHDKFRDTVRRLGRIEIEEITARKAVDTYRAKYYGVPKLWRAAERLLGNPGVQVGPVASEGDAILLPNGMRLFYPDLRHSADGQWSIKARKSNKRTKIWGGAVTENIVQALARIIIAHQLLRLKDLYPIPTMTHDELVMVVPEDESEYAQKTMRSVMTLGPEWAHHGYEGFPYAIPLASEVHAHKVYGNCK